MTKHFTPRQMRKVLDATETPTFTPSTHVETLPDRMNRGTFTPVGWITPPVRLSDAGWLEVGTTILIMEQATPWCFGDWWLARGSRELPAGWTGPDRRTLDNCAIVARAFVITRRRANVRFSHHAELTALPEALQDELLDQCAAEGLSLLALRAEKKRLTAPKLPRCIEPPKVKPPPHTPPTFVTLPSEPPAAPLPGRIALRVELFFPDEDLHARAVDIAAEAGMSLADWIYDLVKQTTEART